MPPLDDRLTHEFDSRGSNSWRTALLLVALAALVIVTPMIFLGNAAGHLNYPAWEVRIDRQTTPTKSHPETGQIIVPLENGTHQVEIRFRRTWDRTAGGVISVLSVVALVLTTLYARRRTATTTMEL